MPPVNDNSIPNDQASKETPERLNGATSSIEALEAHFKTDIHRGLAPKVAEKRLHSRNDESLFEAERPLLWPCIKAVISEPVMWLLLVICVVAMLFEHVGMGFFSAALMLLHAAFCVWMTYRSEKQHFELQAYDIPLTRVIRNGRLLRVRGDRLVPGDIVLLRRGDTAPADLRLINSRGLLVAEDTLFGDERLRRTLDLEKNANMIPEEVPFDHSPENMVYAGSRVKKGSCKAMVVAVAQKTHVGAMVGRLPSDQPYRTPGYLEGMKHILAKINLILCLAVIPLTVIGILTQSVRYDFTDAFMNVFLSVLSLSVLTLTEHILSFGRFHYARVIQTASEDKDADHSVDIRTPETLEKLCRMNHLILMGTAAFHDGAYHPVSVCTSGNTYHVSETQPDASLKAFSEKLFLLSMGQTERLRRGLYGAFPSLEELTETLIEWTDADTEAVLLLLERMEAKGDDVEFKLRNTPPMALYLTDDPSIMPTFDTCRYGDGEAPMDADTLSDWKDELLSAYDRGCRVHFLVSEIEGRRCLEGFLACTVGLCRKTRGCIKALEDGGVKVISFLRDAYPDDINALTDAGLLDRNGVIDLNQTNGFTSVEESALDDKTCYIGCRTADVLAYMEELRKNGACIGVLSVERIDLPILQAADIALTCTPDELKQVLTEKIDNASGAALSQADGTSDSECASDACRQGAHVVLRRCTSHGGGVCGVRRAKLVADSFLRGLTMGLRFICLSQLLRILAVALPLLCGAACVPAPVILTSGLLVDALALYCYARSDPDEKGRIKTNQGPKEILSAPHKLFKAELILTAVTSIIPLAIALVTRVVKNSALGDMAYFCALSMMATQIVIFSMGHLPKANRRGFFTVVLMCCCFVGVLSVSLALGLNVLYCFLLPLIQPLVWLISCLTLRKTGKMLYLD